MSRWPLSTTRTMFVIAGIFFALACSTWSMAYWIGWHWQDAGYYIAVVNTVGCGFMATALFLAIVWLVTLAALYIES